MAAVLALGLMVGCQKSGGDDTQSGPGSAKKGGDSQGKQSIQLKGSDTMVNLGQTWSEEFGKVKPNIEVTVSGGGSGTGIAALIQGGTDIAESSREMKAEEKEQAKKNGYDVQEFVVAKDGLSVIVNPNNSVKKLTFAQLAGIFTGKITNWKEVGGSDGKIVVLSRDKSSGTHVFFLEHVLRGGNAKGPEQYAAGVNMLPSSQAIADEVSTNKDAIGYVGMGYVKVGKQLALAVAKADGQPYVEPTVANVLNNTYPVARPLYFYTPKAPEGAVKEFIDYVLGAEGQKIVTKLEFVPVK